MFATLRLSMTILQVVATAFMTFIKKLSLKIRYWWQTQNAAEVCTVVRVFHRIPRNELNDTVVVG
jgi:hypothetical protein